MNDQDIIEAIKDAQAQTDATWEENTMLRCALKKVCEDCPTTGYISSDCESCHVRKAIITTGHEEHLRVHWDIEGVSIYDMMVTDNEPWWRNWLVCLGVLRPRPHVRLGDKLRKLADHIDDHRQYIHFR